MNWWMCRHVKTISEFRTFDWSKWGFIHMWLWVKCFLIEVPTNQFSKSFERWNICCGQRWEESREPHSSLLFLFPYFYRVECTASVVMRAEGVKQQLRSQVCGGELLDRAVGRWVARWPEVCMKLLWETGKNICVCRCYVTCFFIYFY